MQAVIMAGGFGTRLRPITCSLPKPMAPVANKPVLHHIINLLKKHGFSELTMMLYYQTEIITDYFEDGKNFGISIKYIRPESDLGTAGSVRFASQSIKDTFLVISGDVLTDFDLKKAVDFHKSKKALATMVLTRVSNPLQFGVVITAKDGKIERFLEKPSWGEVFSDTINTGIYILEPEVFDYVPKDISFDFSKDLFPMLLKENKTLYGYIADGYWKDIGNHDEYRFVHYDILDGKVKIDISGKKIKVAQKEIVVGKNVSLGKNIKVEGQVILGDNVSIADDTFLSRSVIGDNVKIGQGSEVLGSVLWTGVTVGQESRIKENVIGTSTRIGDRAVVQVGTIVSDECVIGDDAVVRTNLRIWPHKVIGAGAILSSSLVWGEKWNKALFNAHGISGLGNIEITPEFAAKIGSAYGAYIGEGSYIIVSRDEHPAALMIERGIISGLLSAGIEVGDLRGLPIPVARYEIGNEGEAGGIYIRQSPTDGRSIDIKFFNNKGADISISQEKAIEQLFFREDFKRANMNSIGKITVPARALDYYKTGYLDAINEEVIKKSKYKIVIDYAHSSSSIIFPSILGDLDVNVISLNAFISSSKITKSYEEFTSSLRQLSDVIVTLTANAGFLIDSGSEKVFLVDEKGTILRDDAAMIAVSYLVMKINRGKNIAIAVPVNATSIVDDLAKQFGVKVKRTATSSRNIMTYEKDSEVVLICDSMGGFIFPEFQNAFDAMYAIGKIMEMMSQENLSLSSISKEIPYFEVLHKTVPCSWDKKGKTMRRALEEVKDKKHELIDGVKVYVNNGWVLFVPDSDEALFHIWAEAKDKTTTLGLLEVYSEKIKEWQI
ncbi:MAG: mannose-1-phosphate guanyltransferase [Endomicrobium sp.]|jgi:mannose-1-phosphate guanylyltransferase/phosphomannomutase|nr:mannose-1-phosphate guanyltransferase [Endomicrobium sp.]